MVVEEKEGERLAITMVTTSCHPEATVAMVLQYTDLKQGKGSQKVIIYVCSTQRSSFTCAQHRGHRLRVLNTEVIIYVRSTQRSSFIHGAYCNTLLSR